MLHLIKLSVGTDSIEDLAGWQAKAPRTEEIPFVVARIVLQDFTGVPAVVDLATMRDVIKRMGGDPKKINPLQQVDLVIDHSVQVDQFNQCVIHDGSRLIGTSDDVASSRKGIRRVGQGVAEGRRGQGADTIRADRHNFGQE